MLLLSTNSLERNCAIQVKYIFLLNFAFSFEKVNKEQQQSQISRHTKNEWSNLNIDEVMLISLVLTH